MNLLIHPTCPWLPVAAATLASLGAGLGLAAPALAGEGAGASAGPASAIEVIFNDPGAVYGAWHADIERVALAAGADWLRHFLPPGATPVLTLRIGFDGQATASGASVVSHLVGPGAGGQWVYAQGAAYELQTGLDPNGAEADIDITFGTAGYLQHELWFDPAPLLRTTPVPAGQTDAYSVLQHELGHALGFNGWLDASTATAGAAASTFDMLVGAHPGQPDGGLYFLGAAAMALYGGPVPLTVGNYAHLGNWAPGSGSGLLPDLMNGLVFYRGTRYTISPLNLAMLQDTGLPLAAAVPEPATAALWLAGLLALALWLQHRRGPVRLPGAARSSAHRPPPPGRLQPAHRCSA